MTDRTLAKERERLANRLGEKMSRKLFVYTGSEHPHEAQRPEPISKEAMA